MTPNQVTAVSAAFTYSAIALIAIARPSSALSILLALLLLVGYALDSADGQLARLTKSGRPSGEWLDHVIDMGKICLIFAAVTLSWARFGVPGIPDEDWGLAVPLVFLAVSVVAFFGWLLSDLLIRIARAKDGTPAPPPAGAPVLRSILRLPSDYGLLALTFAWFSNALFPTTLSLLLVANAVILAAALPVWFGQVRASEEAP
jgi:phosphatidylglycerophosphate synthase